MIPRVVTTAGPLWESELVERARHTGALRITQRACHPAQVQQALSERATRAVVVGAEIPWLSRPLVAAWRNLGAMIIGMNDPYQASHGALLEDWGCDFVLEAPDPEWAAAVLRSAAPPPDAASATGQGPTVVAVGGPRGAPGRTEVALGLAWLASRHGPCLLIEADTSPAVGLRLGLSPPSRPYEPVTAHGIDMLLWRAGGSSAGILNSGWSRLWDYRTTVVDLGPGLRAFQEWPGRKVVVCRATPSGIVRAAYFLARLDPGHRPWVVVNRVGQGQQVTQDILHHLGAWTGRPPDATIRELADLRWGAPPSVSLQNALKPLAARLERAGGESGSGPVASQHAQVAHRHQVRIEHFGQAVGSGRVDQVDKEPVPPGFGGGTRFYPGQVGAPGS